MHTDALSQIIHARRAIYPSDYTNEPITEAEIRQVLENARWAPTHKRTEPWQFIVMHSQESRAALGLHMAEHYKAGTTPETFAAVKYEKPIKNCEKSGCIIAIILHRDPQERVAEWEELAAVACAVQNMWLTCTALGIGAYWSSHGSIKTFVKLHALAPNEKCIGYFFMGHHQAAPVTGVRTALDQKVSWI